MFFSLGRNVKLAARDVIKKFTLQFEDHDRPLLGPNYWSLLIIGLVLPRNKCGKTSYFLLHVLATFFVATQYGELYFIRSDLDSIINNLKISMLSVMCIIKANTCMLWQGKWKDLIEYVTKVDKEEREDKDAIRSLILDKYTKYCRTITYSYWFLTFLTFVTVTNTPLMRFLSSSSFREGIRNGTEPFPHIFSSWMPFDKYQIPGKWITMAWHIFICAYGASIMMAYDMTAVVIMVFFGGKLELLKERCKIMLGSQQRGLSDEQVNRTLRKLHHSYILLLKYSKIFNSMLSPVMFVYVVLCSLMLCASAFQFTSANDTTQRLILAEYLIFGVAQLFMYCWHSNVVLYKSREISLGLFQSEWWVASVRQRKSILIFMGQVNKEIYFKAGPFNDLTLSTFIGILKGSYSYYTLLRK